MIKCNICEGEKEMEKMILFDRRLGNLPKKSGEFLPFSPSYLTIRGFT